MDDWGVPANYRHMEGFGVHTFVLVNAEGKETLVKFHWKPTCGEAGWAAHNIPCRECSLARGAAVAGPRGRPLARCETFLRLPSLPSPRPGSPFTGTQPNHTHT